MILHLVRYQAPILTVFLLLSCGGDASTSISARDKAIYVAVEHAHEEAMRIADARYPQLASTPNMSKAYHDRAEENSAEYDAEFSRLIKPSTITFRMTENQLSAVSENVSVQTHAQH